jgi:hypothetical protein
LPDRTTARILRGVDGHARLDDRAPTPAPGEDTASVPSAPPIAAPVSSAAPVPDGELVASAARFQPAASTDADRADEARRRLQEQGIVPIEPDDRIGVMLGPDELVLAVRRSASLDRRHVHRADDPGLCGDLYVTSQRLVHLGRSAVVYGLDEIREADVAANQLLLVVGENRGVVIDVGDPRFLRVEIAAARAAARAAGRAAPTVEPAAPPVEANGSQPSSR